MILKVDHKDLKQGQEQLRRLNRSQKRLILSKQNEIDHERKIGEKKLTQVRREGVIKIDAERNRNNIEVDKALEHKSNRLEEAKNHLETTQKFLLGEEKQLKGIHQDKVSQLKKEQIKKITETTFQLQEKVQANTDRTKTTIDSISLKSRNNIRDSRHQTKMKIDESNFVNNLKMEGAKKRHIQSVNQVKDKNSFEKDQLVKTHRDHLTTMKHEQDMESHQRKQIFNDEKSRLTTFNKDVIVGERQRFQARYNHLKTEHKEVLDHLNEHFETQVNQFKLSHSEALMSLQNKAQDIFYTTTKLEPKITEDEKSYYVSMNVPEHEKNQFSINGDKRTIKIHFARKYFDSAYDKEGLENSTRRTESLTRSFNVKEIVDTNHVTQTYQDQTLTFKIDKA